MRAVSVKLPSSVRYWTVVDDEFWVVGVADGYLQHLRLGQDAAESTAKADAEALALLLRWCERTSQGWRAAAGQLGGFITWLKQAPGDPDAPASGPGVRMSAARINQIVAVVTAYGRLPDSTVLRKHGASPVAAWPGRVTVTVTVTSGFGA